MQCLCVCAGIAAFARDHCTATAKAVCKCSETRISCAGGMFAVDASDRPLSAAPPFLPCQSIRLCDSKSGRYIDISTNAPGVQVYTGNFLNDTPGKDGAKYQRHQSVCLETQSYPNAVNEPNFPNPWIMPGQSYRHEMQITLGCLK
jgi:galactose mutarotase-like enzyme